MMLVMKTKTMIVKTVEYDNGQDNCDSGVIHD